jgi:hypothetical protein
MMHEPVPQPAPSDEHENRLEEARATILTQLLEGSLSQKNRSLSEEEWALLRQVASRPEVRECTPEEFAVLLIESFLKRRLPSSFQQQVTLNNMSKSIARTLCSDPTARNRLLEFQRQLGGPE